VIPNAVTDTVRPYLTGVDVEASDTSAVVALGDSLTDGMLWPDSLAHRLDNRLGIVNEGIAGNCLVIDCMGPSVLARFGRDVLTVSGVKYLIVLAGGSDIGNAPALTAAKLIDAYRTMIALAHAKGILVFGGTLPPFGGSHAGSPAHEQLRQQVNEFIRSGAFDAVIDFDKALANPESPAVLIPAFDSDHKHPNDAGYQAMANAIDLTLLSAR
jgi:lysophospholipase L1-like esterase